jgi:hypothetical protein
VAVSDEWQAQETDDALDGCQASQALKEPPYVENLREEVEGERKNKLKDKPSPSTTKNCLAERMNLPNSCITYDALLKNDMD